MAQFSSTLAIAVLAAVIAGVIILMIEYWTGWFAQTLHRPDWHQWLVTFVKKALPRLRRSIDSFLWVVGYFASFGILLLSIYFAGLLAWGTQGGSSILGTWELILFLTFLAPFVAKPPIRGIYFLVLLAHLFVLTFAAYYSAGASVPASSISNLREWIDPSYLRFDLENPATLLVTCFDLTLVVILAAVVIVKGWAEKAIDALKSDVDYMGSSRVVKQMRADVESDWLHLVSDNWWILQARVRTKNKAAADTLEHCVPLRFSRYLLEIGCTTDRDVKDIMKINESAPYSKVINETLQEILSTSRTTITCKRVDGVTFATAAAALPPKNLTAQVPVP
jgi:hypothetical protein